MKKGFLLFTFLMLSCLMLVACASGPEPVAEEDMIELTLEELAAFDGKDGQPAYIAIDGDIYDVSDSPKWRSGHHNGFYAGNDLTEEIKNISPHGVSKLTTVPMIGRIKAEAE